LARSDLHRLVRPAAAVGSAVAASELDRRRIAASEASALAAQRRRRRRSRGIANVRAAPRPAQMIITQISDSETFPNTNDTRTVSEFETMKATSQIATRATITNATICLRSSDVADARGTFDCSDPGGFVFAVLMMNL
jgi:hypothetical protein